MLRLVLRAAGFADITEQQYGTSSFPELTNLERHPRSDDAPGLPHVIVLQASGKGSGSTDLLEPWYSEFRVAIEAGIR